MDKKLPPSLQPPALMAMPTMVVGVGIDCQVEIPLSRSTNKRGLTLSVADSPKGPVLVIGLSDGHGRALAGMINADRFPAYLELQTKQCGRMRDRLQPQAPEPDAERKG